MNNDFQIERIAQIALNAVTRKTIVAHSQLLISRIENLHWSEVRNFPVAEMKALLRADIAENEAFFDAAIADIRALINKGEETR